MVLLDKESYRRMLISILKYISQGQSDDTIYPKGWTQSNFYIEFLHWNNLSVMDGFFDEDNNVYCINDDYYARRKYCSKLNKQYPGQFKRINQSFTRLVTDLTLLLKICWTRTHQGSFSSTSCNNKAVHIDISKYYPSTLIHNESPIPIYNIHDNVVPIDGNTTDCGEYYFKRSIIRGYGNELLLEAGFYSQELTRHLVDSGLVNKSRIKYTILSITQSAEARYVPGISLKGIQRTTKHLSSG